jgi:hypothetical protein
MSQAPEPLVNIPRSRSLERVLTYLALAASVVLCLPLVLAAGALLTVGSGPVRTQVPVSLHTPLLIAMLGGPLLSAALSGGVFLWRSQTRTRAAQGPEAQSQGGNRLDGLSGLVALGVAGAVYLLLLMLFVHFVAG